MNQALNVGIVINTALGFISALLVEWIIRSSVNYRTRRACMRMIVEELKTIHKDILQMGRDELYTRPFSTSVWDSLVKSGKLDLLSKDPKYTHIVRIYSQLEQLSEWEVRNYTAHALRTGDGAADQLMKYVREERNVLADTLDTTLRKLDLLYGNKGRQS